MSGFFASQISISYGIFNIGICALIFAIQLIRFINNRSKWLSREIFDVESQNRMLKDMSKRPRAYHVIIGYDGLNVKTLRDSGNYKDLLDAYVIFICTFPLFGRDGIYIVLRITAPMTRTSR